MPLKNTLRFGLGFCLSVLLTGVAFWVGSGWLTQQVFGQSDLETDRIDTTGTQEVSMSFTIRVLAIDAEIDRSAQISEVSVQTGGSSLQEMEFEYPLADYEKIEQAIAQDLDLSTETIRSLIRYRID